MKWRIGKIGSVVFAAVCGMFLLARERASVKDLEEPMKDATRGGIASALCWVDGTQPCPTRGDPSCYQKGGPKWCLDERGGLLPARGIVPICQARTGIVTSTANPPLAKKRPQDGDSGTVILSNNTMDRKFRCAVIYRCDGNCDRDDRNSPWHCQTARPLFNGQPVKVNATIPNNDGKCKYH